MANANGPPTASKKSSGAGLVPINKAFRKIKKFDRDDPRAKAIHRKIDEFMSFDDQPFSVVEDPGCYKIPSQRYFSDTFTRTLQCSRNTCSCSDRQQRTRR